MLKRFSQPPPKAINFFRLASEARCGTVTEGGRCFSAAMTRAEAPTLPHRFSRVGGRPGSGRWPYLASQSAYPAPTG